jgi:zinc transport system substrate-binding protein
MRSLAAVLALFTGLSAAEAAPRVMASILPIHAIVAAVMGDEGNPELIFRGTVSEHTTALTPQQLASLGSADLVFMVGPSIEVRLGQLDRSEAVNGRAFVTLEDAPGVTLLKIREGGAWEGHDHDEEEHDAEGHEEGVTAYNGHIWLSPANAKAMAIEIAARLASVDGGNAAVYQANSVAFNAAVDKAVAAIALRLAPVKDRPFIVFHDAYPYFEEAFGLTAVGSISDASGHAPSAKRIGEIQAKIAETGTVCVFREPQFDARFAETVVEGSDARLGVLDAIGAELEPGPEAYLQLLSTLADGLHACLSGQG